MRILYKNCPIRVDEFAICIENLSVRLTFAQLQIVRKVGQLGRYADGRPMQQTLAIYADMLLAAGGRGGGKTMYVAGCSINFVNLLHQMQTFAP